MAVTCPVCLQKTRTVIAHTNNDCEHPDCKEYNKWKSKSRDRDRFGSHLPCVDCFETVTDIITEEDGKLVVTKKMLNRRPVKSARSQRRQAAMLSMVTFV